MSRTDNIAFVRTEMLPEAPPPVAETGVIKWLRENLFSSVLNSILTLISLYLIYQILQGFLPWLFGGVWTTSSLKECREVLDGAAGGCFSVLTERWNQLLFGFKYPPDQYWRITLAFVLLVVAIAPVLYQKLPRKMLYFTGLYPFIGFWLIWGGSIMSPVVILVGFVAGYMAFSRLEHNSFAMGALGGLVTALVIWWLGGFVSGATEGFLALEKVPSRDLGGFMLNMILGVVCVSLSLPIGIALALGRQSDMPIIKWICVVFIEFIRGVPLITLLFVASVLLNIFLPPNTNFDIILRVMIMVTLFAAAYMAEVIRGGLAALPKGQYEGADSLGLNYWQSQRLIIMPQALKMVIPGIVNTFIGLFKDTTLVLIIGLFDFLGAAQSSFTNPDWAGFHTTAYVFVAFIFWVFCFGMSRYSMHLEKKLHTGH